MQNGKFMLSLICSVGFLVLCCGDPSRPEPSVTDGDDTSVDACQTPGSVLCYGTCIDPLDSEQYCGANADCTAFIACGSDQVCEAGECIPMQCDAQYHPYNHACEYNDNAHCGDHDVSCTSGSKCDADTGKCLCEANYHPADGGCAPDSEDACQTTGSVLCHGTCIDPLNSDQYCGANADCTAFIACSSDQVCEAGECIPLQCDAQYHPYNHACEYNDNDHCGDHDVSCTSGSKCDANTGKCLCEANYHPTDGGCAPDSEDACQTPGSVLCHGTCIDPLDSDQYCGANADCTAFITCG